MALVITFLSEPAKGVAELTRVVRPGGLVATYMWDVPGGGLPHQPIYSAMEALGIDFTLPPNTQSSTREALAILWKEAGLEFVDTSVIRIQIRFNDFEEFWGSNAVGVGPVGKAIEQLDHEGQEALRSLLRKQLSSSDDGVVSYGAFANAVKGRVPA